MLTYAILALIAWLAGYNRDSIRHVYKEEQSVGKILLFAFLAILVIPAGIATASRWWLKSRPRSWFIRKVRINPGHRTPTAWDHFFEQEKEAFVRAMPVQRGTCCAQTLSRGTAREGGQERQL